jgi:hypothetical protein
MGTVKRAQTRRYACRRECEARAVATGGLNVFHQPWPSSLHFGAGAQGFFGASHFFFAFSVLPALLAGCGAHGLAARAFCGAHGLAGLDFGGVGAHGLLCAWASEMTLKGANAAGRGAMAASAKVTSDSFPLSDSAFLLLVDFIVLSYR